VVVALEVDVGLLAVHTVVGTEAIEAVDSLRTKVRSDWWLERLMKSQGIGKAYDK
jgi:hypothetical protein